MHRSTPGIRVPCGNYRESPSASPTYLPSSPARGKRFVLSAQPSPVVTPIDERGFFDSPSYRASPSTKALATHWKTAPMAPRMESALPHGFARQRRNGVVLEPFTLTELLDKVKLVGEVGEVHAEPA